MLAPEWPRKCGFGVRLRRELSRTLSRTVRTRIKRRQLTQKNQGCTIVLIYPQLDLQR